LILLEASELKAPRTGRAAEGAAQLRVASVRE